MELGLILGGIGFETIDENLAKLIAKMAEFPEQNLINDIQGYAKMIGLLIALGVGSYECWMMMLARRGIDVMKILRIIIISICISFSGWISEAACAPGKALGEAAQQMAKTKSNDVKNKEKELANLQDDYLKKLDEVLNNAKTQEHFGYKPLLTRMGEVAIDMVSGKAMDELYENLKNQIKVWALAIEMKITECLSTIFKFIGEVLFQVSYYGMLVAQNIFIHLLWAFCPIAFAISLAPPFKSAWSQWLSKMISISLWSFIVYMILYYVYYIMEYNLMHDIDEFNKLLNGLKPENNQPNITAIGFNGLGTTCMYIVGLLVGVFCLRFVPEVASWLIPGGVSSGAGGTMAGAGTGMVSNVGGQVSRTAGAFGKQAGKKLSVNK